jgi:hypothetical protein
LHIDQPVRLAANVQDTFNQLLFDAAKAGVSFTALAAPLVARLSGGAEADARKTLAIATLGLAGPAISGPGAAAAEFQYLADGLLAELSGRRGLEAG